MTLGENHLSGNVTISRQTTKYGSHARWENYTPTGWAVDALRDTGNAYGQAFDILPPYDTTYFWRRTA